MGEFDNLDLKKYTAERIRESKKADVLGKRGIDRAFPMKAKPRKKLKKKGFGRIVKNIERELRKKVQSRRIVKSARATLTIEPREPAPHVSRYFKQEWEEAKKQFYFK
jgi:hypothetical protein